MCTATAIIQVYPDKIGEWRFRFLSPCDEPRLRSSEGYNAKANAHKGIESVARNVAHDKRIDFKTNSRGQHFFTIKARNGKILAVSRNRTEVDELDEDLSIIRTQFSNADVVELEIVK